MNKIEKVPETIKASKFHSNQRNKLAQVQGILTSAFQIKHDPSTPYCYAFFQLEGLDTEIPVIFKIDSNSKNLEAEKPDIPPRAQVLLEGKWADSSNSNRPSFTCLAFEVIAIPPPLTIKELREQISQLLSLSLTKKKEWQDRTDYLFKKKKDLEQLEQLNKLGAEYLSAYLLLKSASYANYQDNLLSLTTDLKDQNQYLNKLASEIEEVAQQVRAYQAKQI